MISVVAPRKPGNSLISWSRRDRSQLDLRHPVRLLHLRVDRLSLAPSTGFGARLPGSAAKNVQIGRAGVETTPPVRQLAMLAQLWLRVYAPDHGQIGLATLVTPRSPLGLTATRCQRRRSKVRLLRSRSRAVACRQVVSRTSGSSRRARSRRRHGRRRLLALGGPPATGAMARSTSPRTSSRAGW